MVVPGSVTSCWARRAPLCCRLEWIFDGLRHAGSRDTNSLLGYTIWPVFLIISGLTGAVISWDHEIDEWLNPDLYLVNSHDAFHAPVDLAKVIKADGSRGQVLYVPLHFGAGHSAGYLVQPRIDAASGKPLALDYTPVFINPVTTGIVGRRDLNSVSLSTRTLMPYLCNLHKSLQMPELRGSDRVGYQFMGIIAPVWLLDSFVAITLTWSLRRRRVEREPASVDSVNVTSASQRRSCWQR